MAIAVKVTGYVVSGVEVIDENCEAEQVIVFVSVNCGSCGVICCSGTGEM